MNDEITKSLAMPKLNPDNFPEFKKSLLPFMELMSFYRCAIMEIETKFNVLNEQFSFQHGRNPIENIKTRLKTAEGIMNKLSRKNIPFSVESIEENLSDVAGVRVICSFPQDVYMLANCLLQQDDITLVEKKDYLENPKPSGYRSLHLIVQVPIFLMDKKKIMKVEVQLRTIAMDFWASLEHKLQYKKNINPEAAKKIREELKSCAEESSALDRHMDDIRCLIEKFSVETEIS